MLLSEDTCVRVRACVPVLACFTLATLTAAAAAAVSCLLHPSYRPSQLLQWVYSNTNEIYSCQDKLHYMCQPESLVQQVLSCIDSQLVVADYIKAVTEQQQVRPLHELPGISAAVDAQCC
jgi:hypothetical protein